MEFLWDDGGRAASGFVGQAGDCVTRAISIATGLAYRDIYDVLGERVSKSARDGVPVTIMDEYLRGLGWKSVKTSQPFEQEWLPSGVSIVLLAKPVEHYRGWHACTLVDATVYDTWNASDDEYLIERFWTHPEKTTATWKREREANGAGEENSGDGLTQLKFQKIMNRLRALESTSSNHASTEGEKRNALKMMQTLMLRHNLGCEEIVDGEVRSSLSMTRMACPLNGRRACTWEKNLAAYLTAEIFPTVSWYSDRCKNRTMVWFYGLRDDVQNIIALYQEMLVTIATAAVLLYGGYSRTKGASYAEGYVQGLPRSQRDMSSVKRIGDVSDDADGGAEKQLSVAQLQASQSQSLAICKAANRWLEIECNIQIVSSSGYGRGGHDPNAAAQGTEHGAKHDVRAASGRKRITN